MDLLHAFQACLPRIDSRTPAEIDAEICEELEFHLAMRTEDNLRGGMSPEAARRKACEWFGDFEANRRACRKIALGRRLLFRRIQTTLLVVLIGAVIYQTVLLIRIQTTSRNEINALTEMVAQLQAGEKTVSELSSSMPYVQWNRNESAATVSVNAITDHEPSSDWNTTGDPLGQPWSDWSSLDKPSER